MHGDKAHSCYFGKDAYADMVKDSKYTDNKELLIIPGSSNPEHIKENLDLFGFELTEEEMAAIGALDRNEKHDWY